MCVCVLCCVTCLWCGVSGPVKLSASCLVHSTPFPHLPSKPLPPPNLKGTAIAINMPMTFESVVIYLGIILAGCSVVSIADSFAATEIASRLRISRAAAIFTQDVVLRGGRALPLYARVQEAAAPMAVVLPADGSGAALRLPLREGDVSFDGLLGGVGGSAGEVAAFGARVCDARDTTNILFSSGTTVGGMCSSV